MTIITFIYRRVFQHLLAHGQLDVRRQGLLVLPADVQRHGVRVDMRVLRQNVRVHQGRPGSGGVGGPVRHDGGQAHGPAGVHRLRVLGARGVLRADRARRLPAHRRAQDQDPAGVLLPAELVREPVPVRAAHATVPPRPVRVAQPVRRVQPSRGRVQGDGPGGVRPPQGPLQRRAAAPGPPGLRRRGRWRWWSRRGRVRRWRGRRIRRRGTERRRGRRK